MKKLFFASLWVLACLVVACSDEKDEPNDEPGSIIGEWVFQKNEYYRNGKLIDSFTAVEDEDKMIAIFREDGTFRYYDYPPKEYYDGSYSYDETSGMLTTNDGVNKKTCQTKITVSTMKWIYDEGNNEEFIEYYTRKTINSEKLPNELTFIFHSCQIYFWQEFLIFIKLVKIRNLL